MDFTELVGLRQSCRGFTDKAVDEATLNKIIENALKAPSACNSQPWKLYVAESEKAVKSVAESLQRDGRNGFSSTASKFIAVAEKARPLAKGISAGLGDEHFVKYDIGEMLAYITLGAKSLGVDSCIIGWIDAKKLKAALDIPDDEICNVVVALGYSEAALREKTRLPKSETVFIK